MNAKDFRAVGNPKSNCDGQRRKWLDLILGKTLRANTKRGIITIHNRIAEILLINFFVNMYVL